MPGSIPQEVIDTVRARADIVDVIQAYIPLKKAGRSYKACCPFHQEKTPSFTVNVENQYYHCFGCGKHGNAITFVMERENVDFPTAVRLLARKYGVFIPENAPRHPSGVRQEPSETYAPASVKDRLFALLELMRKWYVDNLNANPQSPVANYLATRRLAPESILKFGIGASPDSWDAAMNYARRNGYSDTELALAGIIKVSDDRPPKKYDMFRNRLMFPICDELGRVVGFSARTIEADPKMMKYVNTPETPVFKKGRILYAMHFARTEMSENKRNCAILCEGQLDVIAMHAAGFSNSVAAEGTAFTPEQARMLRRHTGSVILALDSDSAGVKAVFRDAVILLPLGFSLKVVTFPGGKDPDELLKNAGKSAIESAVAAAVDFFEFALAKTLASEPDSPSGKARAAEKMLGFIGLLESEAARDSYCAWLAGKLSLSADALYAELGRLQSKADSERERYERFERERENAKAQNSPAPAPRQLSSTEKRFQKALDELLRCLLASKNAAVAASQTLESPLPGNTAAGKVVESILRSAMVDEWETAPASALKALGDGIDDDLSALLNSERKPMDDREAMKIMEQNARIIRAYSLELQINALMEKLRDLVPGTPDYSELVRRIGELNRKLRS